MNYFSTRCTTKTSPKTSAEVIKQGLAEDGGLFMPESIPQIDFSFIEKLCNLSYPERAAEILSLFLTDYTYDELLQCARDAYEHTFDGFAAPVSMLVGDDLRVLELVDRRHFSGHYNVHHVSGIVLEDHQITLVC